MTGKIRVALFIDAENMPPRSIEFCLDHCRSLGKPTVARCYGNVASLQGWASVIAEHHLMPMLSPSGGKKDNATDFALTIDAVSLLHRNLFDCAVIASSDTDFTQLAMHVREHGKGIHGIGDEKATAAMRKAFDRFVVVPVPAAVESPKQVPQQTITPQPTPPSKVVVSQKLEAEIRAMIAKLSASGKVTLPGLGSILRQHYPETELGKGKLKPTLIHLGFKITDGDNIRTA